jgi:integrase
MPYTPAIKIESWARTRAFVTKAVAKCSGKTPYSDGDLSQSTSRLAAWMLEQGDLPLTNRVAFNPVTIERFIADGLPNYAPASRGNRRSILLRMSETLLGDKAPRVRLAPLPPSTACAPYTEDEVAELRSWARMSTGARRKSALALVALGVGAGLSASEVTAVRKSDIEKQGNEIVVNIHGSRARSVRVDGTDAEDLMLALRGLEATDWVFCSGRTAAGKNLVTNFVARTETDGISPNSQRMRATWIVGHLNRGTAVIVLMRTAGVASLEAVTRYVQFAEEAA